MTVIICNNEIIHIFKKDMGNIFLVWCVCVCDIQIFCMLYHGHIFLPSVILLEFMKFNGYTYKIPIFFQVIHSLSHTHIYHISLAHLPTNKRLRNITFYRLEIKTGQTYLINNFHFFPCKFHFSNQTYP